MAEKPKAEKSVQQQLEEINLKTAVMNMKIAERALARFEATEAQHTQQKRQRQADLAAKVRSRARVASQCSHRQGASPKNIYKGKGDTALKKVRMMDGFTVLLHCAICRLAAFSPHPYDRNTQPQIDFRTGEMETRDQAEARVAKWKIDTENFQRLLELSEDAKSDEYTGEMHCGNTFEVKDSKGLPVFRRRPSDYYPQV